MLFKGVAEEGGEFVAPLSLVLFGLTGFDRRGARRGARRVSTVRWIRVSLLGTPKLAITYGLDVRKGEVLIVVQVVEDLVVRGAKGAIVGGFEGSQNDGPKYVVDGEGLTISEGTRIAFSAFYLSLQTGRSPTASYNIITPCGYQVAPAA
jgi:hypothetical protein